MFHTNLPFSFLYLHVYLHSSTYSVSSPRCVATLLSTLIVPAKLLLSFSLSLSSSQPSTIYTSISVSNHGGSPVLSHGAGWSSSPVLSCGRSPSFILETLTSSSPRPFSSSSHLQSTHYSITLSLAESSTTFPT